MSNKRLTIYDFGRKIMSEIELFDFEPLSIIPKNANKSNIYSLSFSWSWNGYCGYGNIDYDSNTNEVCNEFGENFSKLTIDSNSLKQAQKYVSELYNDKDLLPLFTMILQKTDLKSDKLLKEV